MLRRSDQTLRFSVWSEGFQRPIMWKKTKIVLTRLWLRLVGVHRTSPIVIPEDLDLSGIDRTLGGSVWSLPPEHPVNRQRAESDLFPHFLLCYAWGPHLTTDVTSILDLTPYAAITEPPVRCALAAVALPCLSAAPPQPSSPRCRCPALNRHRHLRHCSHAPPQRARVPA